MEGGDGGGGKKRPLQGVIDEDAASKRTALVLDSFELDVESVADIVAQDQQMAAKWALAFQESDAEAVADDDLDVSSEPVTDKALVVRSKQQAHEAAQKEKQELQEMQAAKVLNAPGVNTPRPRQAKKGPQSAEAVAAADVRSTRLNKATYDGFVNDRVQPVVAGPLGMYIMLEAEAERRPPRDAFFGALWTAVRHPTLGGKNKSLSSFRRKFIQHKADGSGRLAYSSEEVGYLLYQAACIYGQPKSRIMQVRPGSKLSYDENVIRTMTDASSGADKLVGRPPWARLIQLAWFATHRQRDAEAQLVSFDVRVHSIVKGLIDVCHVQTWRNGFVLGRDADTQKLHTWKAVIEETHSLFQKAMKQEYSDVFLCALAHLAFVDAIVGYLESVKAKGGDAVKDSLFTLLFTSLGAQDKGFLPTAVYGMLTQDTLRDQIMTVCIREQLQVLSQRISALSEKEVRVDGGGGAEDLEAEFRLRLRFR